MYLICHALHFLQIIRSTFTLTKILNKANASAHIDVCIPLLSTFFLVTLYLINCYLIMYHHYAPEIHYPLILPILFDLYLLFAKCRKMATLIKNFLWGIYWIILPSTWRRALSQTKASPSGGKGLMPSHPPRFKAWYLQFGFVAPIIL